MSNLNNANMDLFTILLTAVEDNISADGRSVLFSPESVIEANKARFTDYDLMNCEIMSTFILLIDQCNAGLNDACTVYASKLLIAYCENK